MEIKIIVATHKPYTMPTGEMYVPVQAGAAVNPRLPYRGDDSGDQISGRNDRYCELTALYWAWKTYLRRLWDYAITDATFANLGKSGR